MKKTNKKAPKKAVKTNKVKSKVKTNKPKITPPATYAKSLKLKQ